MQTIKEKGVHNTNLVNHFIIKNINFNSKVIDLGCGKCSRTEYIKKYFNQHTIGVEIHKNYIDECMQKNVYVYESDIKSFIYNNNFDNFDDLSFLMIDVIEHIEKSEAIDIIEKLKSISNKIIIFTPYGFMHQDEYDSNEYQRHLSSWTDEDFKNMGFDCKVIDDFHYIDDNTSNGVVFAVWDKDNKQAVFV